MSDYHGPVPPNYRPQSRGDYVPPKPYMRPGSHPNAPAREDDTMSLEKMTPEERRQWMFLWLQESGPATRQEVAEAAQTDELTRVDLVATELRKRGSLRSVKGADGKTRWQAVEPVAHGNVEGKALPEFSDQEREATAPNQAEQQLDAIMSGDLSALPDDAPAAGGEIERVAVTGDGELLLWLGGSLVQLSNHETRQLAKLLQVNQRVIAGEVA